jgi:hypothetical protein
MLMDLPPLDRLSPTEQEQFAAAAERVRQLRRRAGVPDNMTLEEALAWRIVSERELERARWGSEGPVVDRASERNQEGDPRGK